MKIAVAGGTGVAGRSTVEALRARDQEAIVIARSAGVDLVTGEGLEAALAGVDAVIDATNLASTGRRVSSEFFEATARTLMRTAATAGVRHIVTLSIIGIDRVPYGYYQGKLRQEQVLQDSVRARGDRRLVVSVRVPGAAGKALAAGGGLSGRPALRGTQTFTDWVTEQRARGTL
jgi:nucleoside-diphosphate-sugar epimerase